MMKAELYLTAGKQYENRGILCTKGRSFELEVSCVPNAFIQSDILQDQ